MSTSQTIWKIASLHTFIVPSVSASVPDLTKTRHWPNLSLSVFCVAEGGTELLFLRWYESSEHQLKDELALYTQKVSFFKGQFEIAAVDSPKEAVVCFRALPGAEHCAIYARIDDEAQRDEAKSIMSRKSRAKADGDSKLLASQVPVIQPVPEMYEDIPDELLARQMQLKNALVEVRQVVPEVSQEVAAALGSSFSRVCIIGDQSAGKSTLLEYIVGCECAFKMGGTGTRRPLVYHVVRDDSLQRLSFQVEKSKVFSSSELINRLGELQGNAFIADPIEVYVKGPRLFTITLVDLPGYIGEENPMEREAVIRINRKYIELPDTLIVGVREALDWKTGESTVKREVALVDKNFSRTVVVTTRMMTRLHERADLTEYLKGREGGQEYYPGAIKFFVDVSLVNKAPTNDVPQLVPEELGNDPGPVIQRATEALQKRVEQRASGISSKGLVGIRELAMYVRHCVVGSRKSAEAWVRKAERELKSVVDAELEILNHQCVPVPRRKGVVLAVVEEVLKSLEELFKGIGPVPGGLTSEQEHQETKKFLDSREQRGAWEGDPANWPLGVVQFPGKYDQLIGGPAFQRFLTEEIQAVLIYRMRTSCHYASEAEVRRFAGIVEGQRSASDAEVARRAAYGRLRNLFVPMVTYGMHRAAVILACIPLGHAVVHVSDVLPRGGIEDGNGFLVRPPLANRLAQQMEAFFSDSGARFIIDTVFHDGNIVQQYEFHDKFSEAGNMTNDVFEESLPSSLLDFTNKLIDKWQTNMTERYLHFIEVAVKHCVLARFSMFVRKRAIAEFDYTENVDVYFSALDKSVEVRRKKLEALQVLLPSGM